MVEEGQFDWFIECGGGALPGPAASVFPAMSKITTCESGQLYVPWRAESTGLSFADYYLAAQYRAHEHNVVTDEVPSVSTRKIKVPDAWIGIGLRYMTPYEMLRGQRAEFMLGVA